MKREVARAERKRVAIRERIGKHMEGLKALEGLEPVDGDDLEIDRADSVLELLEANQQPGKERPRGKRRR